MRTVTLSKKLHRFSILYYSYVLLYPSFLQKTIFLFFMQISMKLLCSFVLPCFVADCMYKIWWFTSGRNQIPYFLNAFLSNTVACFLLLASWLYRTSIFFLVCVLFRLICYLQILRLEDFAQFFHKESDVGLILLEHLTVRRNLRIISHRFRVFILLTLILVTASQFASLLVTTETGSEVNIFNAGELAVMFLTSPFFLIWNRYIYNVKLLMPVATALKSSMHFVNVKACCLAYPLIP